jgi:hypothetical protein
MSRYTVTLTESEPWRSKVGLEGKPLVMGLLDDGVLITWASLSGPGDTGVPQLRMRRRELPSSTVVSRDLSEYTGEPALYNVQVTFADFTGIEEGIYVCEVDAHIAGEDISLPDDGYFLVRFLGGVD